MGISVGSKCGERVLVTFTFRQSVRQIKRQQSDCQEKDAPAVSIESANGGNSSVTICQMISKSIVM